jgi:hypothetical protein
VSSVSKLFYTPVTANIISSTLCVLVFSSNKVFSIHNPSSCHYILILSTTNVSENFNQATSHSRHTCSPLTSWLVLHPRLEISDSSFYVHGDTYISRTKPGNLFPNGESCSYYQIQSRLAMLAMVTSSYQINSLSAADKRHCNSIAQKKL